MKLILFAIMNRLTHRPEAETMLDKRTHVSGKATPNPRQRGIGLGVID
jgi:hypothetical protein